MPAEIDFTEKEIDQLYNLSIESRNNSLSKEQLITKISNLRGGSFIDIVGALGIIGAIIILLTNDWGSALQPNPNLIIPHHLQGLYGNNYQPSQFGYGKIAGSRSITVTGMTQNAGFDKKDPSSGSWDYVDIIRELDKQSNQKIIIIEVADQTYNIKNVKDHVVYNEHDLDRYYSDEIEHKRFDATFQQALAWKRLKAGIDTQDDVTWIKYEYDERHHELKYDSGYSEAHERVQSRYDGYPWENKF